MPSRIELLCMVLQTIAYISNELCFSDCKYSTFHPDFQNYFHHCEEIRIIIPHIARGLSDTLLQDGRYLPNGPPAG